jgi:hypothetical protein
MIVDSIDLVTDLVLGGGLLNDAPLVDLNINEAIIDLSVGVHYRKRSTDLKQRYLAVSGNQLEASILISDDGLCYRDDFTIEILLIRLHFNGVDLKGRAKF